MRKREGLAARRLLLRPLDLETARRVAAGRPVGPRWAADFPAEGDVVLAGLLVLAADAGPDEAGDRTGTLPWAQPWLVVYDGLVVGTVGFKGPPVDGALE